MAIQIPNPGTGNGATGDNEFVLWTKVKDNFSNQTHAASHIVGLSKGQLVRAEEVPQAYFKDYNVTLPPLVASDDLDSIGYGVYVSTSAINLPPADIYGSNNWRIENLRVIGASGTGALQYATNGWGIGKNMRYKGSTTWTAWTPISTNPATYKLTTASNPNVTVDATGELRRSSSSMKYKDLISSLELDDIAYAKTMEVSPIVYRSKCEADPQNWHYLSFSAEELGEHDPALTQWKTHDFNDKGEFVELEQKEAEGINLNAICAVLHATNIYQDKKIKELEQRLTALESNNEPIE